MIQDSIEYKVIESEYGNTKAKRSGVPYMNHIDEGLEILSVFPDTELAQRAYCLHPIFQVDALFFSYLKYGNIDKLPEDSVAAAMEYRCFANNYLAHHPSEPERITWGRSEVVRKMLVADKIQNYKDFLLYHSETHPNRVRLDQYFKEWLKALSQGDPEIFNLYMRLALQYVPKRKYIRVV